MENIQVDTLEDFYLTYTTIMIRFIDTDTLARMMKRVINDISNNENSIIERIQEMDFETKMLLGQGLFDWIQNENYFSLYEYEDKRLFMNKFEDAFSLEVKEECEFKYQTAKFSYNVNQRKDYITITIYPTSYLPKGNSFVNRALLKLNKKNETLKLSYIETPFHRNSKYEVELFYYTNKIYKKLKKQNKNLKFSFHKKYQSIYEDAIKRGYLEGGIYETKTT